MNSSRDLRLSRTTTMRLLVAALFRLRATGIVRTALPFMCLIASVAQAGPSMGVPVRIWGTASGIGNGSFTIAGTFLASTPTGNDGYTSVTESAPSEEPNDLTVKLPMVRVNVGQSYTLYLTGINYYTGTIYFAPTPGYRVIVNNQVRSSIQCGVNTPITFTVEHTGQHPGLAGMASSISNTGLEWRVPLGTTRNGDSAGDLVLRGTGLGASILDGATFSYEPTSPEIEVVRNSYGIQKILANQVAVEVSIGTNFVVDCYFPPADGGDPFGYPIATKFARYLGERIGSGLKITRSTYGTAFPQSIPLRTETMFLERSGSWPNLLWTKTDWVETGQTAAKEVITQSTGTSPGRTESIQVKAPGAGGAIALNVTRTYEDLASGEMLVAETVGTGSALSRTFQYYTDPTQAGSFAQLKSATLPGGSWVAYDYYPSTLEPATMPAGLIKYAYRPYRNAPSTVSHNPGSGEVTYYEYNFVLRCDSAHPTLIEKRVNGVLKSRSVITYEIIGTSWMGTNMKSVRTDSTGSSASLVTTSYYWELPSGGRLPISEVLPDGIKKASTYEYGTWSGSTFSPNATGRASKTTLYVGTGVPGGMPDTTAGESTKEILYRNNNALVTRKENYTFGAIIANSWWYPETYSDYTYDYSGLLLSETNNNGEKSESTYVARRKTSTTDTGGVVTTFGYDYSNRLISSVRTQYESIGKLTSLYTYDAMGTVVREEKRGWDGSTLVSLKTFDDAGRLTSETPAGLGVTTHTYDVANRTHTTTRPDGSTVVETSLLDGTVESRTGTGVVPEYLSYGVESDGRSWVRKDTGSVTSARWSKTWYDWLGRVLRTESPGFPGQPIVVSENHYAAGTGRLEKSTKTGYAPTRYEYNSLGQVNRSGLDLDDNGLILASSDRITDTIDKVESFNGSVWRKRETRSYAAANSATPTTTSVVRVRLNGMQANRVSETQTTDSEGNLTTRVVDVNRTTRRRVTTTTKTGLALPQTELSLNGVAISVTGHDGLTVSTEYDALLRPKAVTDSRGNKSTTSYYAGSSLKQSVIDAAGNNIATFGYDTSGRVIWQSDALNYLTRTSYNLRGQTTRQWGSGTYPVEYGFDPTYGDRTTQSTFRGGTGWDGATWPASPGTADQTVWTYDAGTGLVTAKTDALGRAATQTYNARGQTATRTLARGVTTTYAYDSLTGELLGVSYSDSVTPWVAYTYNRSGQTTSVIDALGTRTFAYDAAKPWRLNAEVFGTYYGNRTLKRLYDPAGVIGRINGYQLGTSASSNADLEVNYGFSSNGRLETITAGQANNSSTRTFRYTYEANAALLKGLSIDGTPDFVVNRVYETQRDLLTSIESKWGAATHTHYDYTYDARAQRSTALQSGDAFADYGEVTNQRYIYNGRGELTTAAGFLGASLTDQSNPLPGRRHEYEYDSIGNRQSSNRTGVPTLKDNYTTNALNQYIGRENNAIPVSGSASLDAVVAVSSRNVTAGRKGRFWSDEVVVNNVLAPWAGPISVYAAKPNGGSGDLLRLDTRTAQVPSQAQTFGYDLDGNVTDDGVWTYQWDAENRLTQMETSVTARASGFAHRIVSFRYDYLGRRVQKRVLDGSSSAEISSRRYLYDGWNVIAEYNAPGGNSFATAVRSYTWGLDLIGSLTESGGVGALLQLSDHLTGKAFGLTYDGNGNVASLVNLQTGALAASYEYSAYGESLRKEVFDAALTEQPFRFSTKWTDDETGLVYYGRRYYDSHQGRFLGRDPIEETGGLNLYGFCGNNSVNRWDYLGCHDYESDPAQWSEHIDDIDLIAQLLRGTTLVWTRTFASGRWSASYNDENGSFYSVRGDTNGAVSMKVTHYNDSYYAGADDFLGSAEDAEADRQILMAELDYFDNVAMAELEPPNRGAGNPNVQPTATAGGGSVLGRVASGARDLIGKVWNLPNTVIGVTVGLVGFSVGRIMGTDPEISIGNNGIQFTNNPLAFAGAITLGNAIVYGPGFGPDFQLPNGTVGDHERQHTYQGQILGPLYLPSNILGISAGLLFNGDAHGPANWNEVGPQANPPRPWP